MILKARASFTWLCVISSSLVRSTQILESRNEKAPLGGNSGSDQRRKEARS